MGAIAPERSARLPPNPLSLSKGLPATMRTAFVASLLILGSSGLEHVGDRTFVEVRGVTVRFVVCVDLPV